MAAASRRAVAGTPPPPHTHMHTHAHARRQAPAELVLRAERPFNFCVIDEVDSILIDEARTPLIISGVSDQPRCARGACVFVCVRVLCVCVL